ncbi:MAG: polyhydroxyalkanoate biosynthesis repressor PhaR [Syntrophomonadaceae bacterium]|nr:polyhydroxyalkanoate biosynthesis repressor PhaR [Syntrophomonadaceae bacterium]
MNVIEIAGRRIGDGCIPLVIAEIGINHEGNLNKAFKMVNDAADCGCECVKIQTHIIEDEMVPNDVVPGNAKESIWKIMERCALSEKEERLVKEHVESKGMIFLSTPFSRAAAKRLERMRVKAYKIGSGDCNNYPLIDYVASFGKPVILSTGMNDISSIAIAVDILRKRKTPYALMHCTSIYPTPYNKVRLGAILELKKTFSDAVVGLSDHSLSNYPCLGAVALGASILARHFTSDKSWPGPDIEISMDPPALKDLITGSRIIFEASGGSKEILPEEKPTIDFAYACVVSIKDIKAGDKFSEDNIWVKRPGTGEIKAEHFNGLIGRTAYCDIPKDKQIKWRHIGD